MKENLNKTGCLMIKIKHNPILHKANEVINQEDIIELEENFHCTIIYGLIVNSFQIEEFVSTVKPLLPKTINAYKISLFENEEDVLKFDIELTPELNMLRTCVKMYPNEETFPNYQPHSTIAFLKPGTGKKYAIGQLETPITFEIEEFILSWKSEVNGEQLKSEIRF